MHEYHIAVLYRSFMISILSSLCALDFEIRFVLGNIFLDVLFGEEKDGT